MAIGTKIYLTISEAKEPTKRTKLYFETTLVNGFSAQHDPRVHIGLGKNEIIEELKISWCGQKEKTMTYSDVKIDQYNDLFYDKQKVEKF